MRKTCTFLSISFLLMTTGPFVSQPFIPPKEVRLTCAPLPYVFDCSISRLPNPQFTSRCFYVAEGQSTLMRADHRMGFSNAIVGLKIDAGLSVTGTVTENRTGQQMACVEDQD